MDDFDRLLDELKSEGPEERETIERAEAMTNDEICYECGGNGDDYSIDENGELVCNCFDCPFNNEEVDDG